jgi:DNA-binding response OmpR family regulator
MDATETDITQKIAPGDRRKFILIVEDETLLAWSLANRLKRSGYEPVVADSGEEAIRLLPSTSFSAVITDVKLPRINGFDVSSAVKAYSPAIPVIIISAVDDENARRLVTAANADRFLEKPFDLEEINRVLDSLTARKTSAA